MKNNLQLFQEILDKISSNQDFKEISLQFSNFLVGAYLYCFHQTGAKQIVIANDSQQIESFEELELILTSYSTIISFQNLKATIHDIYNQQALLTAEKSSSINSEGTLVNQYFYTQLLNILRKGAHPSDEIDQILSGVLVDKTLSAITVSGVHLDYYLQYPNISIVDFPEFSYSNIEYLLAQLFITDHKITTYPSFSVISTISQVNIICSRKFFLTANSPETNFYDSELNIAETCTFIQNSSGTCYFYLRQKTWEHQSTLPFKKLLIDNNLLQSLIFIRTDRENPWILLEISTSNQENQILTLNEDFYINGAKKSYLNEMAIQQIIQLLRFRKTSEMVKGIGMVSVETYRQLGYQLDPNSSLIFDSHKISGTQVILNEICKSIFRGSELYQKQIEETSSNYYLLSQTAVTNNDFSIANMIPITKELFEMNKSFIIKPHDILLLSRSTTNTPALVPQEIPNCIINLNIICIRPNYQLINPIYLFLLLKSTYGKSLIKNIEKGTVLKSISILALKKLILNISSLEQQNTIVTQYLKLLAKLQTAQKDLQLFLDGTSY